MGLLTGSFRRLLPPFCQPQPSSSSGLTPTPQHDFSQDSHSHRCLGMCLCPHPAESVPHQARETRFGPGGKLSRVPAIQPHKQPLLPWLDRRPSRCQAHPPPQLCTSAHTSTHVCTRHTCTAVLSHDVPVSRLCNPHGSIPPSLTWVEAAAGPPGHRM